MGKKISVKFVTFESKVPIVEVRSGEFAFHALVDTGSESTLFDHAVVNKGGAVSIDTGKEMDFVGLNGKTKRQEIKAVHEDFIIGNQPVNIFGLLSDLSSLRGHIKEMYGKEMPIHAILGSDFLKHYDAILDFEEQTMNLYL